MAIKPTSCFDFGYFGFGYWHLRFSTFELRIPNLKFADRYLSKHDYSGY